MTEQHQPPPLDLDDVAAGIVSLWVNNRDDRAACILNDRLMLGSSIPDACTDLTARIVAELRAQRAAVAALRAERDRRLRLLRATLAYVDATQDRAPLGERKRLWDDLRTARAALHDPPSTPAGPLAEGHLYPTDLTDGEGAPAAGLPKAQAAAAQRYALTWEIEDQAADQEVTR